MQIILAKPRGFCAGVDRAIDIVETALAHFGAPIYVRHEVVHNRYVVDTLKKAGAIFVEELHEVPNGQTVIFSAHGVSINVREEAQKRQLRVFDATCPLVTKVHMEVARCSKLAMECILIGHKGHPEVEGTLGQYQNPLGKIHLVESVEEVAHLSILNPDLNTDNLYYVTQTTLSVDDTQAIIAALKAKFPNIQGPRRDDICYATQNRQDAVRKLAQEVDLVLVVGSVNSSNSNRLCELAKNLGTPSYLLDTTQAIQVHWFDGVQKIGVTAGASAPEVLVKQVIDHIRDNFKISSISELEGIDENMVFSMPKELRDLKEQNVAKTIPLSLVN